jgi:hypothetical protein
MGVGPNYVLDKGHVASGAAAVRSMRFVVATGDGTAAAEATSAGTLVRGVAMEDLTAAQVATTKAVFNVRMMGIARVVAGAAVAVGARVGTDNQGRATTVAPAAGANANVAGVALTAAGAAGDVLDVLLTPGGSFQG